MPRQSSLHQPSKPSPMFGDSLFRYWYHLTSPPEPPVNAPLLIREVARRGRVISLVMLVTITMVLFAFLIQPSLSISITLIVVTCVDIIALSFNRRGKITLAGAIITTATEGGLILSLFGLLQSNHGVSMQTITFYPLLVQGIIVAVSTLPLLGVIFVLLFNCIVTFITLTFVPYTPALTNYLHTNPSITFGYLITTPYTVFIIAAFISLIWVHSTNNAIKRADHADARAEYEQEIARRDRERSDQFAQSLQEIMLIVADTDNDPTKEFYIDKTNDLWPLELDPTTELSPIRAEQERRRLMKAALQLASALNAPQLTPWEPTGTPLDDVAARLLPQFTHKSQTLIPYLDKGKLLS